MEKQNTHSPDRTEIALRMLQIIVLASNPRQPAVSMLMLQQSIRTADKFIELLQTKKSNEIL